MGSDAGATPANLTTPFIRAAPALVVVEERPPAFTACWLEKLMITVKTLARTKFFAFILHLFILRGKACSLGIFLS
jgi:hypothetical protein